MMEFNILMKSFNDFEWFVLIVVMVVLSIALLWLLIEQRHIKRINKHLVEQIEGINQDLASLCAAAVHVDDRLSQSGEQLSELNKVLAHIQEVKKEDASPYQLIIQKVQSGVNEQELVKEYGLSRDEAALLIKLHG